MGLFSRIFASPEPKCPISEETRVWMENSFLWLMTQFGQDVIMEARMLTPERSSFDFEFSGKEEDAVNTVRTVCSLMHINEDDVEVDFFSDHIIEYNSQPGLEISTQQDEGGSAGLYFGKNEKGKYAIAIEKQQLSTAETLVATIAHELAHVKILGEDRLQVNDEYLTDLVTVFFGTGIFTANASFRFYSGHNKWGYSKQGYLLQQEWGYALALFAYIRQEQSPSWINYLTPNIKADFLRSERFIYSNESIVLR